MKDENSAHILKLFGRTAHLHHNHTHVMLARLGVYPGQPPLLFALAPHGGTSQADIARELGIAPATVAIMVRRMQKAGLVQRTADSRDARVSRVSLTERGQKIREQMKTVFASMGKECFAGFSPAELASFRKLILKMHDNLEAACKADAVSDQGAGFGHSHRLFGGDRPNPCQRSKEC